MARTEFNVIVSTKCTLPMTQRTAYLHRPNPVSPAKSKRREAIPAESPRTSPVTMARFPCKRPKDRSNVPATRHRKVSLLQRNRPKCSKNGFWTMSITLISKKWTRPCWLRRRVSPRSRSRAGSPTTGSASTKKWWRLQRSEAELQVSDTIFSLSNSRYLN